MRYAGIVSPRPSARRRIMDDDLAYEVLAIVAEIPRGKVATYGQIALMIGRPRGARLVGRIMSHADHFGDYPCHRVVNHAGRTAPGWPEQIDLLRQEGVVIRDDGRFDMSGCRWHVAGYV